MEIFTDEFLEEIGFKRVKIDSPENYGKAIDKRTNGMTVLTWNTEGHSVTYFGEPLEENTALGIGKDAGTRKAFNGYVFTQEDVKRLLQLTY